MKFGNLVTYSYLCNHKRLKLRKNIEVQTNQGMKTIAEQIKWNFKTNGNLEIKDKNGKQIYYELSNGDWKKYEYDSQGNEIYYKHSNGFWIKREYDSKGNEIYWENSNGFWVKWEYDSKGNIIYVKNSTGYWSKQEYDSKGNKIYFEDSDGIIEDNRPKPCEDKVVEIEGVKYKLTKV